MKKFIIKNVGPIKNVAFELKKVNVFMGAQSCGKSTIAKIVSFCQWVEKRYILDGKFNYKVEDQLLDFHRLGKNYFSENTFIEYESDFIKINYSGKKLTQNIEIKESTYDYKKSKNIYIPSERNFVSVIPNLGRYKETNDNIMSFLYDWYEIKRKFKKENALEILNLGVNFYNKYDDDFDVLELQESGKEILLREGSSGLQSIIPLFLMLEYMTGMLFEEKIIKPVSENNINLKMLNQQISSLNEMLKKSISHNEEDMSEKEIKKYLKIFNKRIDEIERKILYHFSNLIIEEPEQNLFPKAQRDLVYFILNRIQKKEEHSVLMTTHSPYILYALNNCLLGFAVKDNLDEDVKNDLASKNSFINPNKVAVWQIENGEMYSVIDKRSQTVSKHFFNEITGELMDEYREMLNYFEYA